MDTELWLPIAGFEGRYEVSNLGRVRSLDRIGVSRRPEGDREMRYSGKVLKPQVDGDGYLHVSLGKGNLRKVHKLVARAFHENPENLPEVDHEDANKSNCAAANLRWCTTRQNAANRHEKTYKTCQVKVSPELAVKIAAEVAAGRYILHIARENGLSRSHVRRLSLPPVTRTCPQCSVAFTRMATTDQTFCSRGCMVRNRHGHPPTHQGIAPEDQIW